MTGRQICCVEAGDDMDTKKIQLVTFDLDGTMLDDEWAHAEATVVWASSWGWITPAWGG